MIYFDNAATTLQKPDCVKEAIIKALDQMGNSGRGVHEASLYAGRTIYRQEKAWPGFWEQENRSRWSSRPMPPRA